MKRSRLFLLTVLFLSSCAATPSTAPLGEAGLAAALARAKKTHAGFVSVRSRAGVSIESPRERMFFDQATLARNPGFLRVALLAPFGETLATVVSDGKSVRMKTALEEVVFDDAENFSLSYLYPGLPSGMGMSDLVGFLTARLPLEVPEENYTARYVGRRGEILFAFSGPMRLEVTVDPRRNVVSRVDYESSDGVASTVIFSDFRKLAPDLYFPARLRFESSGYGLSVAYADDLRVNSGLDVSAFRAGEED